MELESISKINFVKKYGFEIALAAMGAIFFISYQFLYFDFYRNPLPEIGRENRTEPGILIFNQPDEMANYFFIREIVLHNTIEVREPMSAIAENQIHPRSMTVVNEKLVPIGFPGFIVLLGVILNFLFFLGGDDFFNYAVVAITPFFAAIAPFFLYGIIKRFFDDKPLAFISATVLFLHPAWWYYAGRPLQHMTLFVALLIIAVYFFIAFNAKQKSFLFFLSIFFWGLSLYIRPSEWLWTFFLFVSLAAYIKPKLAPINVFSGFSAFILVAVLFFITQTSFYGHPLATGYARPQTTGDGGLVLQGIQGISLLKAFFLPFGFFPVQILKTAYHYGFQLMAPWFIAVLFGAVFALSDAGKKWKAYFVVYIGIKFLILLYYGSWNFSDNLAGVVSIGSSQTRYFLPLYVLSLPVVAFFLKRIWLWSKTGRLVAVMISLVFILFSVKAVFFRFEGLWSIRATIADYYDWQNEIYRITPPDSIIVTRYADKYLFPERKIIVDWRGQQEIKAIKTLSEQGIPVFWYDLKLSKKDTESLKTSRQGTGLTLGEPVLNINNLELRPIRGVENFKETE